MALEEGTFSFGGTVYPLKVDLTNALLADADPGISQALDFFAWGIQQYIGARFLAQTQKLGYNMPSAVGQKLSIEPSPALYADQLAKWPILALYRKRDDWDEHTAVFDKSSSTWAVNYVLPPFTPDQQNIMNPILRAVAGVIRRLAHQGKDKNYLSGAEVWSTAGVQKARLANCIYGGYEKIDANGAYYRALVGELVVLEREDTPDGSYDVYDGDDINVDAANASDETVVADVADTATGPLVQSISPDVGSHTGGQTVTILGTNFIDGMTVMLGNAPATAVVVHDTNTLQCVTGAFAMTGSTALVDLRVTDPNGRGATLSAGYSYTNP